MWTCCVPGCSARPQSSFHRFPANKVAFDIWIERINNPKFKNMSPLQIRKAQRVCNKHFSNYCLLRYGTKGYLRAGSLPTLQLPAFHEPTTVNNSLLYCSENLRLHFEKSEPQDGQSITEVKEYGLDPLDNVQLNITVETSKHTEDSHNQTPTFTSKSHLTPNVTTGNPSNFISSIANKSDEEAELQKFDLLVQKEVLGINIKQETHKENVHVMKDLSQQLSNEKLINNNECSNKQPPSSKNLKQSNKCGLVEKENHDYNTESFTQSCHMEADENKETIHYKIMKNNKFTNQTTKLIEAVFNLVDFENDEDLLDINNFSDCDKLTVTKERYIDLLQKYKTVVRKNKTLVFGLKTIVNHFIKRIETQEAELKRSCDDLKKYEALVGEVFTVSQIKVLFRDPLVSWEPKDILMAFTIRYLSRKTYYVLREKMNYPFPSMTTILQWLSTITKSQCEHLMDLIDSLDPNEDHNENDKLYLLSHTKKDKTPAEANSSDEARARTETANTSFLLSAKRSSDIDVEQSSNRKQQKLESELTESGGNRIPSQNCAVTKDSKDKAKCENRSEIIGPNNTIQSKSGMKTPKNFLEKAPTASSLPEILSRINKRSDDGVK